MRKTCDVEYFVQVILSIEKHIMNLIDQIRKSRRNVKESVNSIVGINKIFIFNICITGPGGAYNPSTKVDDVYGIFGIVRLLAGLYKTGIRKRASRRERRR